MRRKRARKKRPQNLILEYKVLIYGFAAVILFVLMSFVLLSQRGSGFCANSISCVKNLTGEYESAKKQAVFHGLSWSVPSELALVQPASVVLGDNNTQKRIEVNLSNQHLYAYEGDRLVYDFLVSTGKWGRTPTGVFNIWIKLRYTKMEGGNSAIGTYYYLPNVPYVMFFYNRETPKSMGYSLHGTYWHSNFGHPMSHGCVNMKTEEVEKLYYWADPPVNGNLTYATGTNPGTKIVIYGTAPSE